MPSTILFNKNIRTTPSSPYVTCRSFRGLIIASLIIVTLSFLHFPTIDQYGGVGHDQEVYRYIGMIISHGGLPYKDVFEHKPPMIFFLAALGHGLGIWGLWLIMLGTATSAGLCLYKMMEIRKFNYKLFVVFLFAFLARYSPVLQGGLQTREFTAYLILIQICTLLMNADLGSFFFQGLISGMVLMTQQNELLATMPILAYFLLARSETPAKALGRLSVYLLAVLAVCATVGMYFFSHHGLNDFINNAFLFNLRFYIQGEGNEFAKFGRTLATFFSLKLLPYSISLVASTLVLIWARIRGESMGAFIIVLLASIGIEFISISLSGWTYRHYYLGLIPYLVILTMFAVQAAIQQAPALTFRSLFMVCSLCGLVITGHFFARLLPNLKPHPLPAVFYKLEPLAGQKGQIFIFRDSNFIPWYTLLDVAAPTRWIYTFIWDKFPSWDPQGVYFTQILNDLQHHRCRYVLDFSGRNPIRSTLQAEWDRFIRIHYQLIDRDDTRGWKLYQWLK